MSAALLWPAAALAAGSETLRVVLRNDGAQALRCVMIKAHFMSETLDAIAAGDALNLVLQRDPADGALFVLADDGRRQMIENILCGADDDWSETRGELPLLPLRTASAARIELSCVVEGRLLCAVMEPDD
ncbi:MAG: hypothetical protein ACFCUQ_03010 [Kiloniellales bacterium]